MDPYEGAHPLLVERVPKILTEMLQLGHPMLIVEGRRSTERQKKLYAQGRTSPGQIVTHTDGVIKLSNHQVQADGFFHAMDFAFQATRKRVTWDGPWEKFGVVVRKYGLVWGGDWKSFKDRPHVEVP